MAQLREEFLALAALEPRLLKLLARVETIRREDEHSRPHYFCANVHWYGTAGNWLHSIREDMINAVGWEASHTKLRTSKAYDCACDYLYSLLPHCRNCGELGIPYDARLSQ